MTARALALGVAVFLLAAPSARAIVPTGNLLADPGGESVAGAPDSGTVVAPPAWTPVGSFSLVQYGAPDFLTTADSTALGGGQNFFAGGPTDGFSTASQVVDVSGAAAEIDAGKVTATLSGLLGGYASQSDSVTVTAAFGATPAVQIGPVTAADRKDLTALLLRSASAPVPAGTRQITVTIASTRTDGAYNDGYADNLSLTLSGPPVFHQTVAVRPSSGTVLVQVPGSKSFTTLSGTGSIPLGSTIDTRHGRVTLSSVAKAGGAVQTADFYDGLFKVTQSGASTDLTLTEALAPCGKKRSASASASKPKTRKLWGSGSGAFRTRGKYSAATVRGTTWLVQDSCSSTLTRVTRGVVVVRDNVKRKNITLRAGKSYTARAR